MNTVLFDLGGVLIDWNPRHLYRPHFGADEAALEDFLTRVCPPEWNAQLDAGRPFADGVAERQALFPEHAELIALWQTDWERMLGGAIPQTVALLAELRQRKRRLVALTNWSAETFPVSRARFDFLDWFEDIVVSGEVGLIKPDPRIFDLAIERNRLDPQRTLFVDDNLANVEAARDVGLHAVHFRDPQTLRGDLEQLGLL
jgi:2-haloacid dehalogenase